MENSFSSTQLPNSQTQLLVEVPPSKPKKTKLLVLVVVFSALLCIIIGIAFWIWQSTNKTNDQTSENGSTQIPIDQRRVVPYEEPIIAKVGEENIYASDLSTELAYFPAITEVEGKSTKDYLLEKMIIDSILLQELAEPSILDTSIYNSPTKDYLKRTKLTQELRAQSENNLAKLAAGQEGTLLAIWYYNERFPKFTRDEARIIAQQKITAIHEQLRNESINVETAISTIKNDVSLLDLDTNYQGNASLSFKLSNKRDVETFSKISPNLLIEVQNMSASGVSKIYEAKISENEEFFVFAVVDSIIPNSNQPSTFEEWIEEAKSKYDIKIYEE